MTSRTFGVALPGWDKKLQWQISLSFAVGVMRMTCSWVYLPTPRSSQGGSPGLFRLHKRDEEQAPSTEQIKTLAAYSLKANSHHLTLFRSGKRCPLQFRRILSRRTVSMLRISSSETWPHLQPSTILFVRCPPLKLCLSISRRTELRCRYSDMYGRTHRAL